MIYRVWAFSCSRVRDATGLVGRCCAVEGRAIPSRAPGAVREKKRADKGALRMKNVYEVLRQKELEVSRLKREVEALRVAAPLLSEGEDAGNAKKPRLATNAPGPSTRSS